MATFWVNLKENSRTLEDIKLVKLPFRMGELGVRSIGEFNQLLESGSRRVTYDQVSL